MQETRCRDEEPRAAQARERGHWVSCHWAEDIKAGAIQPHEVEAVFEEQAAPAAYEPPIV